jgi:hypothetical protein
MSQTEEDCSIRLSPTRLLAQSPSWLWPLELLVASACLFAVSDTIADPDLWGHLRFGLDMLRSGTIVLQDSYSYTSDRPWINHEWLAELIFAMVYQVGGPGLVVLKSCLGMLILGMGYLHLCKVGLNRPTGSLLLLTVALALRPGLGAVRPQVFTYVTFLLVVIILRAASNGRAAALWWLVPILAAWANLHGGVLAGLAIVSAWSAVETVRLLWRRDSGGRHAAVQAGKINAPIVASFLALACNPHGVELLRFLWITATVPRPEISEWAPLSLMSLPGLAYLALVSASIWAWAASRLPRHEALLVVHIATATAPLLAVRHLPLFALATMILAGAHLADAVNPRLAWLSEGERPARWLRAAMTGVSLMLVVLSVRALRGIRIDPDQFIFPTHAVALMERAGAEGNLIVDFDWGEYVIWHLGPRVKVSIDGRRETVYSSEVLARDLDFREARPGWRALLQIGDPSFALLRRGSRSDQQMRAEPDWRVAYEDPVSSFFIRQTHSLDTRITQTPSPNLLRDGTGTRSPILDSVYVVKMEIGFEPQNTFLP